MIKRPRSFLAGLLFAATALALATGGASAQNLEKFVVKGTKNEISLDTATKIAQAAMDYAAHQQMTNGAPMRPTLYILGPEGNIVYALRMDGEHAINGQTALLKAQTALAFRIPTRQLENMSAKGTVAQRAWLAQTEIDGHVAYAVAGGQPIIVDNQIIGAIGMGGCLPRCDDVVAHGITTVVGPQPPVPDPQP